MKKANMNNNHVTHSPKRMALQLAITTALLTGYGGRHAQAGTCTGGPVNYVCSGAANGGTDVTQSLNGSVLDITTTPGFGIDTYGGGTAISIFSSGVGDVTFNDANNASIVGGTSAIVATKAGDGSVSVTTSGPVLATGSQGIYVGGYLQSGDVTIVTQDTVQGASNAITADMNDGGNITITTAANVLSTTAIGIQAEVAADAVPSDIVIDAQSSVTGMTHGIYVNHNDAGLISIDTQTVSGMYEAGIEVESSYDVSSISINAQGAVSGTDGIDVLNNGSGDLTISTVTVSGTAGRGLQAINFYGSNNLIINAQGTLTGTNNGLRADGLGSGYIDITTAAVTSTGGRAVEVNGFYTVFGNISLNTQGTVDGANGGIDSRNRGNGSHTITTQAVSGGIGTAIDVDSFYSVGVTTIHAQGAISGAKGIEVTSQAYNDINLTTDSTITTTGDDGIEVRRTTSYDGDITVTTSGALSVYQDGIDVVNAALNVSITTHAPVTSSNARGIYVSQTANSDGEVAIITNDLVHGNSGGIMVGTANTYDISINAHGSIQGGSYYGITLFTPAGQNSTVNLNTGASLSQGMSEGSGNATVTVASGVTISGPIRMGDGSDDLTIINSDFSGVTLFDGGDNAAPDDGFSDTLRFQGASGIITGSQVTNWEFINIEAGSQIAFDGIDSVTAFSLQVAAGGTLTLQDGAADDDLTIDAFFTGGGTVALDTVLSDTMPSADVLRLNAPDVNETTIVINNVGGLGGSTTGDGILLVEKSLPSAGTYVLSAPLNVNGYEYTLVEVGVDWYLQGVANDADVGITKDLLSPGPYVVGDTVTYELVVSNNGPLDATNVVVSDTFTNLSLVSVSGGSCAPASFPCTIAALPNGSSETLTVTATIDAVGAFDNSASVSADQPDNNQTNNLDNTGNGGVTLDQFNVGVTVTGLAAGNGMELLNNGGDNLIINSNNLLTNFSMPLNDGEDYLVTIANQPTMPNQTCAFTSPNSGTISGADVTNITLDCVTNTYFVGGVVNGLLPDNYLVLQNNGGDDEIITGNGPFVFNAPIEDEQSYDVTIDMPPNNPIQPCVVNNATGAVMGNDITNVDVICQPGDDLIFRDGFNPPPPPFFEE